MSPRVEITADRFGQPHRTPSSDRLRKFEIRNSKQIRNPIQMPKRRSGVSNFELRISCLFRILDFELRVFSAHGPLRVEQVLHERNHSSAGMTGQTMSPRTVAVPFRQPSSRAARGARRLSGASTATSRIRLTITIRFAWFGAPCVVTDAVAQFTDLHLGHAGMVAKYFGQVEFRGRTVQHPPFALLGRPDGIVSSR